MPQLSLYLTDEDMAALREEAARANTSLSHCAQQLLRQHHSSGGWPADYWNLYCSLAEDKSFAEPAELNWDDDAPRTPLEEA